MAEAVHLAEKGIRRWCANKAEDFVELVLVVIQMCRLSTLYEGNTGRK